MDSAERAAIEAEVRRKASRTVAGRIGFYFHLAVYLLVCGGLAGINLATSSKYLWFLWPLAGWGIGLAMHGFSTYLGPGARERMIEAEVQRELVRRGVG